MLATLFARAGYPTVFVETTGLANPRPNMPTLGKVASRIRRAGKEQPSGEKRLTVYAPLAAPPRGTVFRWLNRGFFVSRVVRDLDRKSTRLNSSHANISYAVFCLKKKKKHAYQGP